MRGVIPFHGDFPWFWGDGNAGLPVREQSGLQLLPRRALNSTGLVL